jgi:hypothetical protein
MNRALALTLIAAVMLSGCGRGGHWPFGRRHRVEAPASQQLVAPARNLQPSH